MSDQSVNNQDNIVPNELIQVLLLDDPNTLKTSSNFQGCLLSSLKTEDTIEIKYKDNESEEYKKKMAGEIIQFEINMKKAKESNIDKLSFETTKELIKAVSKFIKTLKEKYYDVPQSMDLDRDNLIITIKTNNIKTKEEELKKQAEMVKNKEDLVNKQESEFKEFKQKMVDWRKQMNEVFDKKEKEIEEKQKILIEEKKKLESEFLKVEEEKENNLRERQSLKVEKKRLENINISNILKDKNPNIPESTNYNTLVEKNIIKIRYDDYISFDIKTAKKDKNDKAKEEWHDKLKNTRVTKVEGLYKLMQVMGQLKLFTDTREVSENTCINLIGSAMMKHGLDIDAVISVNKSGLKGLVTGLFEDYCELKNGKIILNDLGKLPRLENGEKMNGWIMRFNCYAECLNKENFNDKTLIESMLKNLPETWKKNNIDAYKKMKKMEDLGKVRVINEVEEPITPKENGETKIKRYYKKEKEPESEEKKDTIAKIDFNKEGKKPPFFRRYNAHKNDICDYCKKKGHVEDNCWTKNPSMIPKKFNKDFNNYSSFQFNENKRKNEKDIIYMIDQQLKISKKRIREITLPRGKVRIELFDKRKNGFTFLIDSGSNVHVLRRELVEKFKIDNIRRKIDRYQGVGKDGRISMTGTAKIHFEIGKKEHRIDFLIAEEFPENILSWQRLTSHGKILWFEDGNERAIYIANTRFDEDEDGIYRQKEEKLLDLKEAKEKLEDKYDRFELLENHMELSNTEGLMRSRNIELEEENKELRKELENNKNKIKTSINSITNNNEQITKENKEPITIDGITYFHNGATIQEDIEEEIKNKEESKVEGNTEKKMWEFYQENHPKEPIFSINEVDEEFKFGERIQREFFASKLGETTSEMTKEYGENKEEIRKKCREEDEEKILN